jgi:hypothetical protein
VSWFLLWLLVFNHLYVRLGLWQWPMELGLPPLRHLLSRALVAAVAQQVVAAALFFSGSSSFGGMPAVSPGDGLNNLAWFLAGTSAWRGGWHREPLPTVMVRGARLVAGGIGVLATTVVLLLLLPGTPLGTDKFDSTLFFITFASQVPLAPFAVCTALLLLNHAQLHWHTPSNWVQQLQGASYGVYLCHGWLVVLATYAYIRLLEASRNVVFRWPEPNTTVPDGAGSNTRLPNDGLLVAGFVFTATCALLTAFPLALLAKRVPWLRHFL